jgi:hypothetical protein
VDFDPAAPVLALVIEPGDDAATLRPVSANGTGAIETLIGAHIEAVEIDGGSVLWLDESGKAQGTCHKPAGDEDRRPPACRPPRRHRQRTCRGSWRGCRATRDLISVDITPTTLAALTEINVPVRSG